MPGIGYPHRFFLIATPLHFTKIATMNPFLIFADPPPPFNAANSRAPTAPASTETCHPCSSFVHPIVNCFPKNGQNSPKRSCSSFFSCLTQFLILSLSLMTFLLILMQQVLLTDFPQNQSLVTQIWKFKNDQTDWMPSHFKTWSSEKENHENHSVVIEGTFSKTYKPNFWRKNSKILFILLF